MEGNFVVSRRMIDAFDVSPSDSEEAHVLAVDDSLVDRKVIERLLKISSFKGLPVDQNFHFSYRLCLFHGILNGKTVRMCSDGRG